MWEAPIHDRNSGCEAANSRLCLYESESLLAHLDFLARAFRAHGLPLALYVDFHSFFHTHTPDTCTQRGAALHFYGVALRFAPTPQAKGKIERRHDYWQKRLPPLLAADKILELEGANHLLDLLLPHANIHEIHRELDTPPQAAWNQAVRENRSVLRPVPACPWWPFIWSQRTPVRVGDNGKVPVGAQLHSVDAPPRSTWFPRKRAQIICGARTLASAKRLNFWRPYARSTRK